MKSEQIVVLLKQIITKCNKSELDVKGDLIRIRMLAGMSCHYNGLCTINNKPFMSKDKAAKKKTMSDVSGKLNVDGLYSSIQSDGET